MNSKEECAFWRGFIKAANGPNGPLGLSSISPKAEPNIPLDVKPNNNYSVSELPQDVHKFNNQSGNTLNINAHGGTSGPMNDQKYEYAPDPSFKFKAEPNIFTSLFSNQDFSPEDVAKKMGPGTNNINNLYSLACNGGNCYGTNAPEFNPNKIIPGYATPASYRQLYPNLTNVVQQPAGTLGAQIPSWYPTNAYQPTVDFGNALNQFIKHKPQFVSLPHQYQLQGGTNWIDKGKYLNY